VIELLPARRREREGQDVKTHHREQAVVKHWHSFLGCEVTDSACGCGVAESLGRATNFNISWFHLRGTERF
jgi:hypothetical protein